MVMCLSIYSAFCIWQPAHAVAMIYLSASPTLSAASIPRSASTPKGLDNTAQGRVLAHPGDSGHRQTAVFTPKGLDNTAQGRVLAHPGDTGHRQTAVFTPKGLDNTAQGRALAHTGEGQ